MKGKTRADISGRGSLGSGSQLSEGSTRNSPPIERAIHQWEAGGLSMIPGEPTSFQPLTNCFGIFFSYSLRITLFGYWSEWGIWDDVILSNNLCFRVMGYCSNLAACVNIFASAWGRFRLPGASKNNFLNNISVRTAWWQNNCWVAVSHESSPMNNPK